MEESDTARIRVVCRLRPLNDRELQKSKETCIEYGEENRSISVRSSQESSDLNFTFDYIFSPSCKQKQVYEIAAKPVITAIFEGFNGTILAYGQTSSGKTFTMTGNEGSDNSGIGIIPRIINDLFYTIQQTDETIEFTVRISYCEIYLEKIKDLIDPSRQNLKIQEDKARGVFIPELSDYTVKSPEEVYEFMKCGKENREFGETLMNESSSRSHTIFIVTVSQNNTRNYSAKTGKLYLVDLAGSEKVAKTGAAGKRLEEAKNINKSLTTLGLVITALTDSKSTYVPYRDSKLTRVLQDSLGGNAKTTLILTCSPSSWNEDETISTLRFGTRAKAIKNKPKLNKEFTIHELKLMLYAAKEEINKKDKIILSLRGENFKGYEDEQSVSILSLPSIDIAESVKEIEKLKENLVLESNKVMRLTLENNEKQALLNREKRENSKLASKNFHSSTLIKAKDDDIKVKDEIINHQNIKITDLQSELDANLKNFEEQERTIEDLQDQNHKKSEEIITIKKNFQRIRELELSLLTLQTNLDNERNTNKKTEEENCSLREKLQNSLEKSLGSKEIQENIREAIQHKEKEK